MEVPFSEAEKRFVLAEAIKNSSVPIERLLTVLSEGQVSPAWTEMLLPHGRNLKSCIEAFDALLNRSFPSYPPNLQHHPLPPAPGGSGKRKPPSDLLETPPSGPPPKRRQSGVDPIAPTRTIQPKPASNGSPQSFSPLAAGQQPKKRGRPSKADVEARNAEAIARGEVIPPPRTPGPRIPQMPGLGSFDPRSPVQRDLVPSPRIIAPTPPIAVEGSGSFAPQITGQVTAIAPVPVTDFTSPPRAKTPSGSIEAETAASNKKRRARPSSKAAKGVKAGESSFPATEPGETQFQATAGPSTEKQPREEEGSAVKPEAENPPSNMAQEPPPGTDQPAPSQKSDT